MKTQEILKKIKATDIKTHFYQDDFYGKVCFKINGVSFEGLFDIDSKGLYAIELQGDLIEMDKLINTTDNESDNKTKNSDSPTNETPLSYQFIKNFEQLLQKSDDALAEGFGRTGDANCLSPSYQTGDIKFDPNT